MANKRKRTSPAQRDAARAASKKEKKAKEAKPEKVAPKPHVWGKTGWCSHDLASTNIVKNHTHCKQTIETPSVVMHCPCLCHAPGVMDLLSSYELTLDSKCSICHGAGRPVKKNGKKMWKCEQKHRWPRKGK